MTSAVKLRRKSDIWRYVHPAIIMLVFFVAGVFFLLGQNTLAIAIAIYGIIIIEVKIAIVPLLLRIPGTLYLATLIRSSIFFLPALVLNTAPLSLSLWGIAAGIGWGVFLQLCQLNDLKLLLSDEFVAILPPLSQQEKFSYSLLLMLSAIGQEYFYRGVILYIFADYIGPLAILVSTLLFILEHMMHYNASRVFDKYDVALQTLLSVGLCVVFYLSNSLVGCILGHIVYNSPSIIQTMRRQTQQE